MLQKLAEYPHIKIHFSEFCLYFLGVCIISGCLGWLYGIYIRRRIALLPDDHPHKPIQTNNKWENDDIRDILKVSLISKMDYDSLNRYQILNTFFHMSHISFMVSGKRTALSSAVLVTIICQKLDLKRSVENKIC